MIFGKGGGVQTLFVARQPVEKCHEHSDVMYAIFVYLKKAYDSMLRYAVWHVLERYGVPPTIAIHHQVISQWYTGRIQNW